jgi:glycosyltransferase involved in cell wall biosynthesis
VVKYGLAKQGKEALMSSTRRDAPHRWGTSGWSSKHFLTPGWAGVVESGSATFGPEPGSDSVLSVVVPARDEAASLPRLVAEIAEALRPLCDISEETPRRLGGFEVVVVDDGSTDETRGVLERLRGAHPELVVLSLKESAGQSAAIAAGFRIARGDWVATLDADLQNDPADLAALWSVLPGHDAALGWREHRQDVWSKRVISRWANRVRNRVLGQSIRDTGCSVRIIRRSLALRLPMFRGAHRFLGPLLLREGCRLIQVPVNHRARPHGASHYNFRNRSIQVVVDLLGVAWLMRRPARYEALEDPERSGSGASSPSTARTPHSSTRADARSGA